MNKKGQFFLIAAVIIVGIIITISAINISTKPSAKEQTALYDLTDEIDYESSKLIDYGIYQEKSSEQTDSAILSLVQNYSMANPGTDLLLVYGNQSSLTVLYYNKTLTGSIGFSTGGGTISGTQYTMTPTVPSYVLSPDTVNVQLSEDYTIPFELQTGENFFIRLEKKVGEETIVAQK